jgi:hypothetical protein
MSYLLALHSNSGLVDVSSRFEKLINELKGSTEAVAGKDESSAAKEEPQLLTVGSSVLSGEAEARNLNVISNTSHK